MCRVDQCSDVGICLFFGRNLRDWGCATVEERLGGSGEAEMGIELRVSKLALAKNGRYAHARQMQCAKREQKQVRTCRGRVIRDIERKVAARQTEAGQKQEHPGLKRLLEIAKRIHAQHRQRCRVSLRSADPGELYEWNTLLSCRNDAVR